MKQSEAKIKKEEIMQERKRQGFCFFIEKGEKKGFIPEVKQMTQMKIPLIEVLEGRQARRFAIKGMDAQRKLHEHLSK